MHLIRLNGVFIALSLCVACGPELPGNNPLVGVYSNRGPGSMTNDSSLLQYEVREDGTFSITRIGSEGGERCNSIPREPAVYSWRPHGEHMVEVSFPGREVGGADAWRITRGPDCSMRARSVKDGVVSTIEQEFIRGAVCLEVPKACPQGEVCGGCSLVWCDEPPSPCDADGP